MKVSYICTLVDTGSQSSYFTQCCKQNTGNRVQVNLCGRRVWWTGGQNGVVDASTVAIALMCAEEGIVISHFSGLSPNHWGPYILENPGEARKEGLLPERDYQTEKGGQKPQGDPIMKQTPKVSPVLP